jgi:hypothetical protein
MNGLLSLLTICLHNTFNMVTQIHLIHRDKICNTYFLNEPFSKELMMKALSLFEHFHGIRDMNLNEKS